MTKLGDFKFFKGYSDRYRGTEYLEASYIYIPYLPMQSISVTITIPDYSPSISISNTYETTTVNSN